MTIDKAFYCCLDKIERALVKNNVKEDLKKEPEQSNVKVEKGQFDFIKESEN